MEVALDQVQWHDREGRRVRARFDGTTVVFSPWRRGFRDFIRWASGKSQYYISKLLNLEYNAAAFSFPGTLYFALWTATLSASSTGATAGECSYTGYTRVAVTANTTNFPTSSSGAAIQNATAITWPANGGSLQTATYIAWLDVTTLGAGNILYWGSITSTAINAGDTPQIAVNALTASES